MKLIETPIHGAFKIELRKIGDERGFFCRSWCKKTMKDLRLCDSITQINTSYNEMKGTLRGLHFQQAPYQEVKIMQCTQGAIFDVIVDIRPVSPSYLKWFGVVLKQNDGQLFYIPEGCAHGYQTLTDQSSALYSTSVAYTPKSESGLRWNDPVVGIEWPVPPIGISEKDQSWPLI